MRSEAFGDELVVVVVQVTAEEAVRSEDRLAVDEFVAALLGGR